MKVYKKPFTFKPVIIEIESYPELKDLIGTLKFSQQEFRKRDHLECLMKRIDNLIKSLEGELE